MERYGVLKNGQTKENKKQRRNLPLVRADLQHDSLKEALHRARRSEADQHALFRKEVFSHHFDYQEAC